MRLDGSLLPRGKTSTNEIQEHHAENYYSKCRITGYSSRGGAACLDRKQVIEAATIVYENCQLNDAFVAGGAALSGNEEGVFEGVLLEVATD